jgi:hypothetical protein
MKTFYLFSKTLEIVYRKFYRARQRNSLITPLTVFTIIPEHEILSQET